MKLTTLTDTPLLDGSKVFELMDTNGLPLEVMTEIFRERSIAFNVIQFIEAAIKSKNFTYETAKKRLIWAMVFDDKLRSEFSRDLDLAWKIHNERN